MSTDQTAPPWRHTTITQFGFGVQPVPGNQRLVVIVTPDGARTDYLLSDLEAESLGRQLTAPRVLTPPPPLAG